MNKAVFLDRDGTINIDKGYIFRIQDFKFLPGAIDGLRKLQELGFLLIIITNQSGIARGYYTERELLVLNEWLMNELEKINIKITNIYYCPHHPEAIIDKYRFKCRCRKPGLKFYETAIKDYDLDISQCWAIGNELRDIYVCKEYNCRGILVGNDSKFDKKIIDENNLYLSNDLLEAAEIVRRNGGRLND